jgi:hypothetical protein
MTDESALLVGGLTLAVLLLSILLARALRLQVDVTRKVELMERRMDRMTRAASEGSAVEGVDAPQESPRGGDAVDVRGTTPKGEPVVVDPVDEDGVVFLFLSTTCGICLSLWRNLVGREDALKTNRWVVVLREHDDPTDVAQDLLLASAPSVVMSDEAFADYEIPGSPYVVVVGSRPTDVVAEGPIGSIEDALMMTIT